MADTLSTIFQALADPTRRAILTRLREGPSSVGDLAAPFHISKPAISQHLKVLETAGLIERETRAQWRTCSLRTEPLDDAAEWVNHHREMWNEQFDLLDQRVQHLKNGPTATSLPTRSEDS
jgi:DNA-binding transcriptional ArsR family regulator